MRFPDFRPVSQLIIGRQRTVLIVSRSCDSGRSRNRTVFAISACLASTHPSIRHSLSRGYVSSCLVLKRGRAEPRPSIRIIGVVSRIRRFVEDGSDEA